MNALQQNIRVNVADLAKLFSSESEFKEFQLQVSDVFAPTELFCMWFDDTYMPEDMDFVAAFSPAEHESINAFSSSLDKLSAESGDPPHEIDNLLKLKHWAEVKIQARILLKQLEDHR
jgi:hypothetical protein